MESLNLVIAELRFIYAALGIGTVIVAIAGAFFAVKWGVGSNKKDIERHTKHFSQLFDDRNDHNTRITVLEDGINGIRHTQDKQDKKLENIRTLIIERNNNRPG